MNVVQRAFCFQRKNSNRVVVYIFTIMALLLFLTLSFIIKLKVEVVIEDMKNSLGAEVAINIDYFNNSFEKTALIQPFPQRLIEEFSQKEEVMYTDYTSKFVGLSVHGMEIFKDPETNGVLAGIEENRSLGFRGVENEQLLDIIEGTMILAQGRTFTRDEISLGKAVTLIPKAFAELNNLRVGDAIEISLLVDDRDIETIIDPFNPQEINILATKSTVFEIIGIVEYSERVVIELGENAEQEMDGQYMSNALLRERDNKSFIVPNKIVQEYTEFSLAIKEAHNLIVPKQTSFELPRYILKSPDDITSFINSNENRLPSGYVMSSNMDNFQSITQSLRFTEKIANIVFQVVSAITVILLFLVTFYLLNLRKKEILLLIALGESKKNIAYQQCIEFVVSFFIACLLSFVLSTSISAIVIDEILINNYDATSQLEVTTVKANAYYNQSMFEKTIKGKSVNKNKPLFLFAILLMIILLLEITLYIFNVKIHKKE